MIPGFLRVTLQRLGLLLAAYAFTRAFFLLWNWDHYAQLPSSQLMLSFVHGARFDLSAILFTNIPLLLIWILPTSWLALRWVQRSEFALFMLINSACLGLNIMDSEYVKFIGKRNSLDLLLIREDVRRQGLVQILENWNLALGWITFCVLLAWVMPRFKWDTRERVLSPMFWLTRVAFIGLAILGMRGGWQFKPLHPMHAYFTTSHELGLLTLNTPFNLLKSRPRGEVHRQRYFATDKEAIERLQKMTGLSRPPLGYAKGWNVVVFILESFSLEYVSIANDGKGYTPFMDELSKNPKAFFFPHNFANARRSIEGLPAVLCGMPAMMAEPIITSDFANNRLDCMPKVLGKNGYSTYFLHGAHNGSMHFDTFSNIAGFEHFIGLNEFPKDNPADFDEAWGVLDEPMFQYAAKKMGEASKPVLLSVFSLSSHSPYFIPPQHRGKFKKGTLEIHETIGYTDYSLREFFKTAEKESWFNNTIFIITADHTQKTDQPKYADLIGPWRVPFLVYIPGLEEGRVKVSPDRLTQHADIAPSVYDLIGLEVPDRLLVGQSIFDSAKPGRIYNYTSYGYWYMNPEVFLDFGRETPYKASTHKNSYAIQETDPKSPAVEEAVLDLKAIVHYVNEGLLGNSLHTWKDAK